MLTNRQLFLQHVAQTSDFPMMLEIEQAEGMYMTDTDGKKYMDLIAGISVSILGHRNKAVVEAIKNQIDKYMHLMVYGEFVQSPQVEAAQIIVSLLPKPIDNVYFVNSGSEATEGALKLSKRYTGKTGMVAFGNAYHGSTHGALSLMSNQQYQQNFRPLLPDVKHLIFNNIDELNEIDNRTACVVVEPIQGEAGAVVATYEFMQQLRNKCTQTGALLIVDEIQTGFGRTGKMFGFQHYDIVPDIVLFAKGMGGGMPIGAFAASSEIMSVLKTNPVLGHITTFGGHPVSCAAAHATIRSIAESNLVESCNTKAQLFRELLIHPKIISIQGKGLLMAVDLGSTERVMSFIKTGLQNGIVSDWFLFNSHCTASYHYY